MRKSDLVSAEALARVTAARPLPDDPARAAAVLVEDGLLTRFQARLLLAGRHRGCRVGPYTILDQAGKGGMGAVYVAEHAALSRKVALKVLTGLTGGDQDRLVLGRFLREARAAAALDHPNIVRIYDVLRHDGGHFLVMEYVDGVTLEQLFRKVGPLPVRRAADYVAQAAAGLQHAHERGFVHRDVKPANLMAGRDGRLKVLDMGLTRSADARDRLTDMLDHGAVVGTADYLAPEIALGAPADARSDLYSLGATLFALLAGRPPFAGSGTQKLIHHQTSPPPDLTAVRPDVPAGLAAVAAKLLAKRPADRYGSAAEVVAALAPWLPAAAAIVVAAAVADSTAGSSDDLRQALSGGLPLPAARTLADASDPTADTGRPFGSPADRAPRRPAGRRPGPKAVGAVVAVAAAVAGGVGYLAVGRPGPAPPPAAPVPAAATTREAVRLLQPADAAGDRRRAAVAVARHRWAEAADRLAAACRAAPDDHECWRDRLTLLAFADPPEYRKVRADALARWADARHPVAAVRVATAALLLPAADRELAAAAALARRGLAAASPELAARAELGAALADWRQGQVRAADARLAPLDGGGNPWATAAPACYIRSMVLRLAGDPGEANALLARGRDELFVPHAGTVAAPGPGDGWPDLLAAEVLRREAMKPTGDAADRDRVPLPYRLDLSAQRPFRFRATGPLVCGDGWIGTPLDPTGDGRLPAGWCGGSTGGDAVVEVRADRVDGHMAVGGRVVSRSQGGLAALASPELLLTGMACRVRFEYATAGRGANLTFDRSSPPTAAAAHVVPLEPTDGRWVAKDLRIDLNGAMAGYVAFLDDGPPPADGFWVRALEVTPAD